MKKKSIALLVSTGAAGLVAGGVLMGGLSANAADNASSAGTSPSYGVPNGAPRGTGPSGAAPNGNTDPRKPMRGDEKLLTGDTLAKVTAAVKAKYPGATFQRVETDSDGVYEAHLLVAGKPVTVEVDTAYAVTGTEAAPTGGGDHDGDGPGAQAPAA